MWNEVWQKRKGKIIAGIVVFISAIYVFILFLIPHLIVEYQLFYVQGRLTEWPGYGGLKYTLGETIYLDNAHLYGTNLCKGNGWGEREADSSWTIGNESEILLVMKTQQDLVLTIETGGMLCEYFEVFVNNDMLGSSNDITNNKMILNVSSQLYEANELFVIKFIIKNPVRPCDISDSSDDRVLGIQVKNITFSTST